MRRTRLYLLGLCLIAVGGCNTPSVPIPPPSPDNMTFALQVDSDSATFEYRADPSFGGAVVYVFNRTQGEGLITTAEANGSVMSTVPFPGLAGDHVVVTFELEAQLASTCVELQEGRSNEGLVCPF